MSGAVTLLPSTPCTRTSLPSFLRYSSTLKMGAVGSCEMIVTFCQTIKSHIPESNNFVGTATRCISNLTHRLTCQAIQTFRKVMLLSSLVRVRNGGGTYLTNAPSRPHNQRCDNLKCRGCGRDARTSIRLCSVRGYCFFLESFNSMPVNAAPLLH